VDVPSRLQLVIEPHHAFIAVVHQTGIGALLLSKLFRQPRVGYIVNAMGPGP